MSSSIHEPIYIALSRALNKAKLPDKEVCCVAVSKEAWQACVDNIIPALIEVDSDFNREAFLTACEAQEVAKSPINVQALINEFKLGASDGRTAV